MANRTFIPAFKAGVGDWNYYVTVMKYAQVKNQVNFAHELSPNQDLNQLIQRGLGKRTEDIKNYLLKSEHRFLGAMIVACWGGEPQFQGLQMDDPDGMLSGIDQGFGVLILDGTQQFFALDGQHRLKAIKDALPLNPSLASDDICVLLVAHYDTPDGRERTQRLFTNINRNAKATTSAENIALDVDDGYAIVLRGLLSDHDFLKDNGRVKIFAKPPNQEGEFTLAGASIAKTDPKAWSTITVFYDVLRNLGFGLDPAMDDPTSRPNEDILAESQKVLGDRVMKLLDEATGLKSRLLAESAAAIRSPKGNEGHGHAFMRPVVQKAVVRALRDLVDQGHVTWDELIERLAGLNWHLNEEPWTAVFNTDNGKMITAKENTDLLHSLVVCHLAPSSKTEINRVRKEYKEIRGRAYKTSAEDLAAYLPAVD